MAKPMGSPSTEMLCEQVFAIRAEVGVAAPRRGRTGDMKTGRPGISHGPILALGVLSQGLDADHARIIEPASQRRTVRQMPGHAD
jgi:hypothetical protein